MHKHSKPGWMLCLVMFLSVAGIGRAADGELTRELAGTKLTYQYEGGRRYDVSFTADTISWHRLDVARDPVADVPYVARRIEPGVFLVNWHRPEHTEYITILFDFNKRLMYTSGLLEGRDRHFEAGKITSLERSAR
ncbi:MAG: hypothetical protein RL030_927 [Pseudomonadota bacterium]